MLTALLLALASLAAAGGAGGGEAPRVVALSINPIANPNDTPAALAKTDGVGGTFLAFQWSDLEPSPGRYALAPLTAVRTPAARRPLAVLLGLEVINTTAKETPGDLLDDGFDSPKLLARFHALVDAIRPYLERNVRYVAVGNEVDIYLARHRGEWAAYGAFVADAVAYLHRVAPWVQVGVSSTVNGVLRHAPRKLAALTRSADVSILTYYPLKGEFQVRPPSAPARDFPKALKAMPKRPLVLQEVGYPDATVLGSSQAKQATFVRSVFRAWKRAGARIPFANFTVLHDSTSEFCARVARYYGRPDSDALKAYLCSLGLRDAAGRPKPAWAAFTRESAAVR